MNLQSWPRGYQSPLKNIRMIRITQQRLRLRFWLSHCKSRWHQFTFSSFAVTIFLSGIMQTECVSGWHYYSRYYLAIKKYMRIIDSWYWICCLYSSAAKLHHQLCLRFCFLCQLFYFPFSGHPEVKGSHKERPCRRFPWDVRSFLLQMIKVRERQWLN